jgi:hypothetical protein
MEAHAEEELEGRPRADVLLSARFRKSIPVENGVYFR